MYLAMTQSDFEEVIEEAPRIVAKRLGLAADLQRASLRDEINRADPLAAGLLEQFINVYTEWWTTSTATIQGGTGATEAARNIQRLIDKRGLMRSALMNYLNAKYPADCSDHLSKPENHPSAPKIIRRSSEHTRNSDGRVKARCRRSSKYQMAEGPSNQTYGSPNPPHRNIFRTFGTAPLDPAKQSIKPKHDDN